ncbi:MAG TPA: secretin N-terminal domain-containing protein, partial [Gemmataceae bacterium]|nr:secretin N-terminal domain-containing protein [Gemmataceae bacterium]
VGPGRRWLNLDDLARPRRLDLLTGRADGSIIPERAIYKLEGDVLTLTINAPDRPRPTGFRADRKSPSTAVYTLHRWADDVAESEKTAVRIFVLKQAPASEVERVLRERLQPNEGRRIHLASEGRINAVIVRVRRELLAEVEAAVSDLDRKAASRSVR